MSSGNIGRQVAGDANNCTYLYYDALGRKTQMTDPDMGTWYYKYDNGSNLLTQVDARANAVCTYYDEINRVKGKNHVTGVGSPSTYACPGDPGSYTVAYTYDAYDGSTQYGKGYRTGMTDTSGSAIWKYDTRGRVKEESKVITGGGTFKTQWTFNARDLALTQIYPGGTGGQAGETVTSGYDVYGRPSTLTGTSNYVTGTDYTAEGRIDLLKLGNTAASPTLKTDYVYYAWTTSNGRGRLQQLKTGTPSVTDSLQDLRYSYDAVGNVTQVQDYKAGSPETMTYTYDDLDRLTAASGGYSDSIAYNTIGNITSKTGMGNYAYQDGAHKHAVTHLDGVQKYWYDANGNMTSRTVGSSFTLTYDVENRLTGVSGGASATFTYDGDGNRVKATAGGVTTYYVGNHYEYGSTVKKYYYHAGKRVAMYDGATLNWLLGEHLGSTTVTANSSGTRTGEIRYKAYGASRYTYGTTPTTYHFTGQREESTIGLYYYGARWYDPALGRFVQADTLVQAHAESAKSYLPLVVSYAEPGLLTSWGEFLRTGSRPDDGKHTAPGVFDPQLLNRYAYARNNPIAYLDASGHWIWCVVGAVAGGVIGLGAYALTHRDSFEWKQAALWAAGGAIVGGTLGAGAEWVAGAIGTAKAASTATITILWLEQQAQRVQHIMDPKHAWDRLIQLSGNVMRDYQAIQPYLQEVIMSGQRTQRATTEAGIVWEFVKTINGQEIVVTGIELATKAFQIADAWIKTR